MKTEKRSGRKLVRKNSVGASAVLGSNGVSHSHTRPRAGPEVETVVVIPGQ